MGKTSGKERLQQSLERRRELNRERARRFYDRKKKITQGSTSFNRQAKKRILDNVKAILPRTPKKKADIVASLIDSPETRNILVKAGRVNAENAEQKRISTATVAIGNVKEALSSMMSKRDTDSRVAVNVGISMLCGNQSGMKSSLSKELGVTRRRIAMSTQHRLNALSTETPVPWTFTKRKTRNDAMPEEHRKLAHDFWAGKDISRPTGNKRDVSRKRISPNNYLEHEKHILETTQTEAYQAFQKMYPDIEMGQRYFENCKPFYVVPARLKDRNSCCCRAHVEIQMLFKSCMKYRQTLDNADDIEVFTRLTDLVNTTLCEPREGEKYHNKDCLTLKGNATNVAS